MSDFQVGDTVCADLGLCETCVEPKPAQGNAGAFAEYAVAPTQLCAKTDGVDPVAAAGLKHRGGIMAAVSWPGFIGIDETLRLGAAACAAW